jgi:hypothetical protein
MANHYLYRDGSNFKIRGSLNKDIFYVHTSGVTIGVPTGIPGLVQSFSYFGSNDATCNIGNSINFFWTDPSEDEGGNTITSYAIRRIGVNFVGVDNEDPDGIPGSFPTAWSGNPQIIPSDFYQTLQYGGPWCAGDPPINTDLDNPVPIGNINSISIDGWACGIYSFQIAAINASGTGNWYPTEQDFANGLGVNFGATQVGSDEKAVSISGGLITATYTSNPGDCSPSHINFQSVSGDLWKFGGTKVNTYLGFTPGTVTFSTGGLQGWYYINITEFYTDYSTTCADSKNGCIIEPFYVT